MALYNNLHDYRFNDTDVDDIRGASVYGVNDEKLGKIDDVIFDDASGELRYAVVDSGGWLSSNKFLVPARQLMIREESDKDFHANLTKEQIEKLPRYDEKETKSETDWNDYEGRYEAAWGDGPVLHREGSTHILTPEVVPGAGGGSGVSVASPRRIAHDMPRFGATSSSDEGASDTSLAGEATVQPAVSGTMSDKKSFGGVPDATSASQEKKGVQSADDDLREDQIGRGRPELLMTNARLRAFEERLRRDREEIARHRGKRVA
jgi:hypothetical protein